MKQCIRCHQYIDDNATFCNYCGQSQYVNQQGQGGYQYSGYNPYFNEQEYYTRNNAFDSDAQGKSRGVFALLAIFLGGLGIQYFYVGKTTAGFITILLSLVSCGLWEFITLIQGIVMLCSDNYSFENKFVKSQSSFPLF